MANVYQGVAIGLRRRGFDVLTTAEAGRRGASDEEQLAFAAREGRCLFTFNRGDFANLHGRYASAGQHHAGIVLSPQVPIGAAVKRLAMLLSSRTSNDLREQLAGMDAIMMIILTVGSACGAKHRRWILAEPGPHQRGHRPEDHLLQNNIRLLICKPGPPRRDGQRPICHPHIESAGPVAAKSDKKPIIA